MADQSHDVVVVGGGISGCALLYVLARYCDLGSVALLEKYDRLADVNSSTRANSQTLHCGDIETNYTLEKARRVRRIADMIGHYGRLVPEAERALHVFPKMVLAVGERETDFLRRRHEQFAESFPYMHLWEPPRIAEVEPAVALVDGEPRREPILASGCSDQICAVDFGTLARSFAQRACAESPNASVHLNTRVRSIEHDGTEFLVHADGGRYHAPFVVVSAGAHSLLMAHQLGYGLDYSILPVAGSFYLIPKRLNGKVYTVQSDKLPFAALHADPDLALPGCTRIGPTALLLPKLERYRRGTYWDFWKAFRPNLGVAKVFRDLLRDRDIRAYMIRNLLYEVPGLRKRLFLQDARKIIPSLQQHELTFAKGMGGIRPQVIDRTRAHLQLGEATINPGTGIIFNMTPSPGASTCLGNAYRDAQAIAAFLGRHLDRDRLIRELLDGEDLAEAA